jgi:uncharacterized protein YjdB
MNMKKIFCYRRLAAMLCLTAALLFTFFLRTGSVRAEENDQVKPDNGIPVIYLNIDESEGTIEEMLASKDHSVYCYGTLSIEVPEGFHYSDFEDLPCESFSDLAMSIRGRGNTTWAHEGKRPFKIKLDKKTDIFGLGKNKHWVLVANAFDETLLRDRVTAWLADQLGFEFTPRGVPVDLVMKGQEYGEKYLGSYYFSENVRVDDNRLEIDELSEDMTEEPEITGGYLLQNPSQLAEDSPDRFKTSRGTEWATETPSFDTSDDGYENEVQQKYIQNHMQKVEDALFADGTGYRELMDIESSAKYWLINEMTKNSDGYGTGSTYIYKKRDKDEVTGKVYWGPVWDFDQGWDRIFNVNDFTCGGDWVVPMFCDREEGGFVEEVRKQWLVLKQAVTELTADGGIIDQYYAETKASAEKDRRIWHPDDTDFSYLKEVNELKDWARKRLAWMDENFFLVDDLAHKVKFMADDELYALQFKPAGDMIHGNEEHPDKEGYYFTGWADEEGNIIGYNTPVTRDMVLTAQYVAEEDATHAEDITFRKNSDVVTYSYYFRIYTVDYEIIPADAVEKAVEWSVSDESFASVDQNGTLTLAGNGPGEVTVYAKLRNGVVRNFTLNVISEDTPAPESVYPLEETIYMTPGQMKPFIIDTVPSPAKINEYEYVSADESVVTVDEYGVLTAAGPGQTTVHLTTKTPGENWDEYIICETEITVIVTEDELVIEYTVVSGDQSTWKQGSEDSLTITVKRSVNDEECFRHFKDVLIDGNPLEKDKDYTAGSGSTVITLKASALKKLAAGEHTVTAEFDDGTAETKVTIAAKDPDTAPDTSDHRDNSWPAYIGASLIVFALAFAIRWKYAGTR